MGQGHLGIWGHSWFLGEHAKAPGQGCRASLEPARQLLPAAPEPTAGLRATTPGQWGLRSSAGGQASLPEHPSPTVCLGCCRAGQTGAQAGKGPAPGHGLVCRAGQGPGPWWPPSAHCRAPHGQWRRGGWAVTVARGTSRPPPTLGPGTALGPALAPFRTDPVAGETQAQQRPLPVCSFQENRIIPLNSLGCSTHNSLQPPSGQHPDTQVLSSQAHELT